MRRSSKKSLPVLVVVAMASLSLAACGGVVIDPQKAEDEITKDYEAQVPGSDVESVTCPDEIESADGTTAVCKMTLTDGTSGDINLEVLDDEGNISWEVADPVNQGG